MAALIRLLALVSVMLAVALPQTGEYQLKCEVLVRFASFVEFPEWAFADDESPLVIGVFGDDPFGPLLEQTTAARRVKGRRIEVRRIPDLENLAAFGPPHVLFVPRSQRAFYNAIFELLADLPVLSVGEEPTFARDRGVVNLLISDNRPELEIANEHAVAVGLRISSQLLNMVHIIDTAAPVR